jgi:hypothetical protein
MHNNRVINLTGRKMKTKKGSKEVKVTGLGLAIGKMERITNGNLNLKGNQSKVPRRTGLDPKGKLLMESPCHGNLMLLHQIKMGQK